MSITGLIVNGYAEFRVTILNIFWSTNVTGEFDGSRIAGVTAGIERGIGHRDLPVRYLNPLRGQRQFDGGRNGGRRGIHGCDAVANAHCKANHNVEFFVRRKNGIRY